MPHLTMLRKHSLLMSSQVGGVRGWPHFLGHTLAATWLRASVAAHALCRLTMSTGLRHGHGGNQWSACNTEALPHHFDAAFMQRYLGPALPATAHTICPQASTQQVHTCLSTQLSPTACCRCAAQACLSTQTAAAACCLLPHLPTQTAPTAYCALPHLHTIKTTAACCRCAAQACLAAGWDVVVAEEVGLDDTTLQQLAGEGT